MGKNVITIPATISRFTSAPLTSVKKRKVAAYARVSTDHEDQLNSYEAQVDYYTNYIKGRDDWEFVSVYSDEGVTGCNTKKRDGFNRMIEDALNGFIDLIVTKSVSRFARNTVDSLSTIRKLKEHGIEVYFEKESIWTFDSKGELLITIMSSLAQEESRSISENSTWGQRKRFADGKVSVPFKRFLGYDRGKDGNLVVNEAQARIVKRIYGMYLSDISTAMIARKLTEEHIPTPGGKQKWSTSCVRSILTNEKYKGDALLQKVYTTDFLTKKKKKNEGEVPQYYIHENHTAIIDGKTFALVQTKLAASRTVKNRASSKHIFSGKLKCGDCGSCYGSKVWHSNDIYRGIIWQCNHKFDGEKCTTPSLKADEIKALFIKAANAIITERDELISVYETVLAPKLATDELEKKVTEIETDIVMLSETIDSKIRENAVIAMDQDAFNENMAQLEERLSDARTQKSALLSEIACRKARSQELEMHFQHLKDLGPITEFRDIDWLAMVDHVEVCTKNRILFTFKDGSVVNAAEEEG